MNGAALAAKYALPPNALGYCGSGEFRGALKSGSQAVLEKELKKFKVHYAYLSLIARENGLGPFDLRVVRAFWTGNRLLENVSRAALRAFIRKELFGGRKGSRAEALARNLPEGILPHHSFNSLYVNFVTGKVAPSVRNLDSCCITWGEVLSAGKNSATLRRACITWDGGFALEEKDERVALSRAGVSMVQGAKKGDFLAVHWGVAVEKLTDASLRKLERYTRANIDAINGGVSECPI
ncbi:MAG: DUF6390 family protein [Candidatus Micrarchaeota archaeon]